jgi:hypothetical protein
VNAVTIDYVGSDETAEFKEVVPIASVSRESRSFKTEDSTDCAFADTANEIAKAGTVDRSARRAAEVRVDDRDVAKTVRTGEIDKLILPALALEILLHLRSCRLPNVDDGATLQDLFRKLTKRHREPRFRSRAVRPRAGDVREEPRPRPVSSDRGSTPSLERRSRSALSGWTIVRVRHVVFASNSSDATVPEDPLGFADRISSRMLRTSRRATTDARRTPRVNREQNAASNIHAGTTTAASSKILQTYTSPPPRFSRY